MRDRYSPIALPPRSLSCDGSCSSTSLLSPLTTTASSSIFRPLVEPNDAANASESTTWNCARFDDKGEPEETPKTAQTPAWRCPGFAAFDCQNRDPSTLTNNGDGGLSCPRCGVVVSLNAIVETVRDKNCAEEDDKTMRADRPKANAFEDKYKEGHVETAEQARKRRVVEMGGTIVPRVKYAGRANNEVANTHAKVASQAAASARASKKQQQADDASETISVVDASLDNRRRQLQLSMVQICNALGKQPHALNRHFRITADHVLDRYMLHSKHCTSQNCQISLATRCMPLLALATVRSSLQILIDHRKFSKPNGGVNGNDVEMSIHELQQVLETAKQKPIVNVAFSRTNRVASIVGLILNWSDADACVPCEATAATEGAEATEGELASSQPPQPPQPSQPSHVPDAPPEFMLDNVFPNKAINTASLDFAYEIRTGIIEIAHTIKCDETIRNASIRMLHCKELLEFLLQEEQLQALARTVVAALLIEIAIQRLERPTSAQLCTIIEAIARNEGIDSSELHRLRSHIVLCSAEACNDGDNGGGGAAAAAVAAAASGSSREDEDIF
jgi:hypothetical protein